MPLDGRLAQTVSPYPKGDFCKGDATKSEKTDPEASRLKETTSKLIPIKKIYATNQIYVKNIVLERTMWISFALGGGFELAQQSVFHS